MASTTKEDITPDQKIHRLVEWFGLAPVGETAPPEPGAELLRQAVPGPGRITLITGGSGSGKSMLLAAMMRLAGGLDPASMESELPGRGGAPGPATHTVIRLPESLPEGPILSLFPGESAGATLARVAWTGLGEPAVLLRPASTLSTGERFRLQLALALREAEATPPDAPPPLLVCDEFTSALDDGTAAACARTLSRAVRGPRLGGRAVGGGGRAVGGGTGSERGRLAVVVATWREELVSRLRPDVVVHCDYGLWQVTTRSTAGAVKESRAPSPVRGTAVARRGRAAVGVAGGAGVGSGREVGLATPGGRLT